MSRHSEYSIRDNATGVRQAFRFGYRASSQKGGSEAVETLLMPAPVIQGIEESNHDVDFAALPVAAPESTITSSLDRIEHHLAELLSKIGNDPCNRPCPELTQEALKSVNVIGDDSVLESDELRISPLTAPGLIDPPADSHSAFNYPMPSAPSVPSAPSAPSAPEAQVVDTAQPQAGGSSWWQQAGGADRESSDSHMVRDTSSIERMVSGFVTTALRGGMPPKKKTASAVRRAVSSVSSSEQSDSAESSESESESSEEVKPKKKKASKADKSDKEKRPPTGWMLYMSEVRALTKGATGANNVGALSKFAAEYKKKAEATDKTGDAMYKAALDMLKKEWASGAAKKRLAEMASA